MHEPNSFKLCYRIEDYGPYQIQLEDGNLLIAFDHQYAIIKLSKSYFQKINIAKFEKKNF